MTIPWGVTRSALVVLLGAGLTYAAAQVPFTATLTPAVERSTALQPTVEPVVSAALSCPGPETEGVQGVPPVAGTTTVYASSPPPQVLSGLPLGSGSGSLTLATAPGSPPMARADAPGVVVHGVVTGATVGEVSATGPLAPGLAALQVTVSPKGDDRAAVVAPCRPAAPELWVVAGGGGSTRRERVVLANPGANTVSADVTVLGAAGALPSANGRQVSVPPHGRTSLLLDALVGPEASPVVHVVASGGVLTGVVEDSWIDGATGRGADDAVAAAAPADEQVLPVASLNGPARLRVAATGPDETVVQARLLGKDGPTALPGGGVLRVPGGAVRELDLSTVPPGEYAIQVRADHPVVAGAMVERRTPGAAQTDFGWTSSTAPVTAVSGTPLPVGGTAGVMLVATGGPASATVYSVSQAGTVDARPFSMAADTTATLEVSGASQVWVRRVSGTVRAGVGLTFSDPGGGPLLSLVPLDPAIVSVPQVPVRQVSR